MATDSAVMFEGRRWPAARAVSTPFRRVASGRIVFTASGKGQQWTTDRPLAFWRSFSTLDLSDTVDDTVAEAGVETFLKRHGDPAGGLDRGTVAAAVGDTFEWGLLIERLRMVAEAWNEPNERGISSMSRDKYRLEIADKALRLQLPGGLDAEIRNEIDIQYTDRGLTLRPQTLRAFMTISAASARERGINMKQCLFCSDWFELRRSDAVYCSPSCQATDHKRKSTAIEPKQSRQSI